MGATGPVLMWRSQRGFGNPGTTEALVRVEEAERIPCRGHEFLGSVVYVRGHRERISDVAQTISKNGLLPLPHHVLSILILPVSRPLHTLPTTSSAFPSDLPP